MPCGGVRVVVTDRETIRPVTVGLAIARTLRSRHRDQFRPEAIQNLLLNRATMWAFLRNQSLDRLVAWTETAGNSRPDRPAPYLSYRQNSSLMRGVFPPTLREDGGGPVAPSHHLLYHRSYSDRSE